MRRSRRQGCCAAKPHKGQLCGEAADGIAVRRTSLSLTAIRPISVHLTLLCATENIICPHVLELSAQSAEKGLGIRVTRRWTYKIGPQGTGKGLGSSPRTGKSQRSAHCADKSYRSTLCCNKTDVAQEEVSGLKMSILYFPIIFVWIPAI